MPLNLSAHRDEAHLKIYLSQLILQMNCGTCGVKRVRIFVCTILTILRVYNVHTR